MLVFFKMIEFLMIKILFLVITFFISFVVNASGETVCPSSLTCDYETGLCDMPSGWALDTGRAVEDFSNQKTIGLSKIVGYKTADKQQTYDLRCHYTYGEHSIISVYTYVKALTGSNWVFSGFGKNIAECSDVTDPTTCAGANQLNGTPDHKVHLQQIYKAASLTEASSSIGYYKYKDYRTNSSWSSYSCLPQSQSPSGWDWVVSEQHDPSALPLCECTPGCRGQGRTKVCTFCS